MSEQKSELQELLKKPISKCIYSFLIPFLLILWIFTMLNISIDSNKTVLVFDLNNQYVSYLSYLRNMFENGNDFFYTFSKTLGGDMAGLSAYYLLSPLNIILFLFSADKITNAIYLIILFKIGFSGLSFYYFISKKNGFNFSTIIFSTSYALMAYNLVYQTNIMWLDGIVLLPLILLGIENIIDKKSGTLYVVALFLSIFSCYYIGYMICIFSIIYMAYRIVLVTEDFNFTGIIKSIKSIGKYIFFSIIAGGLAAFVWIPSLKSLSGGKASFDFTSMNFSRDFNLPLILTKLYTGSFNIESLESGLPNIFCGILMLLLFVLYFLNKNIKLKEKIASAVLTTIIILSFYISGLNLIWHGFNPPAGFPYRYSFVFSFIIIYLAYKCFKSLKGGFSIITLAIVNAFFIGITVLFIFMKISYLNIILVIIDMIIFIIFSFLLYKYSKFGKKIFIILIALISFANIWSNGFFILNKIPYFQKDILNYVDELNPVLDDIKETDKSFYRIEKTFYYSNNDPMLLSYNGLSHFSSSEKAFVKDFLGKLGYRNNGTWAYYNNGSTVAADSLLGVKYVLSKGNNNSYYTSINGKNNITTSKNPYALPLGFMASSDILNINMSENNLFELQNNIFKSITKSNKQIFISQKNVNISTSNINVINDKDYYVYEKLDDAKDAYIEYTMTVDSLEPLYVHFPTEKMYQTEIFLNDKSLGDYFDTYRYDIVSLGSFKIGDTVKFKMKLNSNHVEFSNAFFYYQNMNVLKDYHDTIISNQLVINSHNSSHIEGTVDVQSDYEYMLFTIPYEKSWVIKVDGNIISSEKAFDTLTAVKVTKGYHIIELQYIPAGFYLGLIVSLIALGIFIIYLFLKNIMKKKLS